MERICKMLPRRNVTMDMGATVVALVVGCLQGMLEWLPVSSEGTIVVALTLVDIRPAHAVRLALFVHAGTALSALGYYRAEYATAIRSVPRWRPATAFEGSTVELSYIALATLASAVAGLCAYLLLETAVSVLAGGAFVALVGLLLILTGVVQRFSGRSGGPSGRRTRPDVLDAVLVGVLQGFAVLPGVSRSGVTASALLLRGHGGTSAFRYSFLLGVPAALGAGILVIVESGGLPTVSPEAAILGLAVSATVGYITIDAMMRLLERVSFWGVCIGFGTAAIVGGALLTVA